LIWGANGWIAGLLKVYLESQGIPVRTTTCRMEDRESVFRVLDEIQPTHVLNCAGVTGRPNVDWCESHKEETVRSNAIGTLNLTDCCFLRGIHVTVFATGCIYHYDKDHPIGGLTFTEEDRANFEDSFYSYTKSRVEDLMKVFPNVLILRLRMPVSDDLHPRSFVTKITKYERVVDIPNSNTLLTSMLPCAVHLTKLRDTGVYNFTNPGAISHNEVLSLYRDIVNPSFTWKNFSIEEQSKILKAGRSNCELDSTKLVRRMKETGGPHVPDVRTAYVESFERMRANLLDEGHERLQRNYEGRRLPEISAALSGHLIVDYSYEDEGMINASIQNGWRN
jgi:dTDP-4-dehydrorhamnose reductase